VEPAKKLKPPEVRELTLAEQEQLGALGEAMAQQALGPDWKERQEERRALAESDGAPSGLRKGRR
jgi:hypothetical protein